MERRDLIVPIVPVATLSVNGPSLSRYSLPNTTRGTTKLESTYGQEMRLSDIPESGAEGADRNCGVEKRKGHIRKPTFSDTMELHHYASPEYYEAASSNATYPERVFSDCKIDHDPSSGFKTQG